MFDEIVVVAGQSNAITQGVRGAEGLPLGWMDTPRVQYLDVDGFVPYCPESLPSWGPEAAFARSWLSANANNTKVLYVVRKALAGSQLGAVAKYGQIGIAKRDWSPSSGQLFAETTASIRIARADLHAPRVTTILFIQGEADCRSTDALADYAGNCAEAYAAMRMQWGDSSTKIVTHTVSPHYDGYPFDEMLARQQEVAALDRLNFICNLRDAAYQDDRIHLAPAGVNALGEGCYRLTHQRVGGLVASQLE